MYKSISINGRPLKSLSLNGRTIWQKKEEGPQYFCVEPAAGQTVVAIAKQGNSAPALSLVYSFDGETWRTYTIGSNVSIPTKMYFKATSDTSMSNTATAASNTNYNYFKVASGKAKVSGNLCSLLQGDGKVTALTKSYTFARFFYNCTLLDDASGLYIPSDLQLTTRSLAQTFNGCANLRLPPDLRTTKLGEYCYAATFLNCKALTKMSRLPATTLASACYNQMFQGCISLTETYDLPATSLASSCYYSMFSGCTSLVTAPYIMATRLANGSLSMMFNGCGSLNQIKINYTGAFGTTYSYSWVAGVSSSGDFYYNGSNYTWGDDNIPHGWAIKTF